jgi:8-oxo-dGTP pyrophosphatase MutT (NUDIX family)
MGQRGRAAVFMPSKYVFPGGAVDAVDDQMTALDWLAPGTAAFLDDPTCDPPVSAAALAHAARRELAEETGLHLTGSSALTFFFRAVTPPGNPRRFDARFFLAPASAVAGNSDDFSGAEDELVHLHWIGLSAARVLDLPFITEVVLSEATAILSGQTQPGVPFFDNYGPVPTFRRITG